MAPTSRSAGRADGGFGCCRHSHKAVITARKLTALSANGQARPRTVMIRPPSAGPMARAMLMPTPLSATAWVSSGRGTRSGVIACQAGAPMAVMVPSRKVNRSRSPGVTRSAATITARSTATAAAVTWRASSSRRRSIRSARAPAGSANRNTGSVVAAWISATISGAGASEVISQAAATSCIQVPMLEITAADQIRRKLRSRRGAQGETPALPPSAS